MNMNCLRDNAQTHTLSHSHSHTDTHTHSHTHTHLHIHQALKLRGIQIDPNNLEVEKFFDTNRKTHIHLQ